MIDRGYFQRVAEEAGQVFVTQVRNMTRAQLDLWQQIPYLALMADGRTGYLSQLSRAYRHGYWAIEASSRDGWYNVYVDLENGELVDAADPAHEAHDKDILGIAACLGELDVQVIIESLQKKSQLPTAAHYQPEKQEEWRASLRKQLGLEPSFYIRRLAPAGVGDKNLVGLVE